MMTGVAMLALTLAQAANAPATVTGGPAPADGPAPYVGMTDPATDAQTDASHCNLRDMVKGTTYGRKWQVGRDYRAELWFSKNNDGDACLQTLGDHGFQVDWDIRAYGFLNEVGRYGISIPPDAIRNDPKARFRITRSEFNGSGGYTGLYGWFGEAGTGDTVEYYINETWGGLPIDMRDCVKMGTLTVDGGTYDIYMRPHRGKRGEQWWSNRQTPRTEGTISYARHFAAWRKYGMANRPLTRVAFSLEPHWGSPTSGTIRYETFSIDAPRHR